MTKKYVNRKPNNEFQLNGLPLTRLDNFPNSAAASLAFLPANSLFSTASALHYHNNIELH